MMGWQLQKFPIRKHPYLPRRINFTKGNCKKIFIKKLKFDTGLLAAAGHLQDWQMKQSIFEVSMKVLNNM